MLRCTSSILLACLFVLQSKNDNNNVSAFTPRSMPLHQCSMTRLNVLAVPEKLLETTSSSLEEDIQQYQQQRQQQQQQYQSTSLSTSSTTTSEEIRLQQQQQQQQQVKSWTDDGFVFGLQGSGLERPKGKVPVIVVDGDTLETKLYQQIIVLTTFSAHAYFVLSSILNMYIMNGNNTLLTSIQAISLLVSSWILADFGSGVLHWSVDNYGNGRTPIMGSIIAAFQGHHSAPWTITQRGFCNNVYKLCIPFGIIPMSIIATIFTSTAPSVTLFMSFFCIFEILSQEFHKWSHQLPSETPQWVNTLQKIGITINRKPHAQHHLAPFDGNYCIISGLCNTVLDTTGFFRRLEHIVYKLNGVESNAWKLDPELRTRTLAGDYSIPAN